MIITAHLRRASLALLAVGALAGCSRHVVADPSAVRALDQSDWTIQSEPAPPPAPPPPPPRM